MSKNVNADRPKEISRRDFLKTAAIGAAVASIGPFAAGPSARSAKVATTSGPKAGLGVAGLDKINWIKAIEGSSTS